MRRLVGRNRFLARNVYGCTTRPAVWASATRLVGVPRLPPVVERVVLAYLRQPLDRTQRLQFGQREVFGEPAGDRGAVDDLRGPAGRELRSGRDVCGTGDLRLVPRDEYVIAGGYEVGLDE